MSLTLKLQRRKSAGFTLIEITVVILLVAVCGIAMGKFFSQSLLLTSKSQTALTGTYSAETALEKIAMSCRELRSSADISNFTSTQFSFVENNGNADNFSLSGSTILLNSQTLLNNVSSLTFSYYDKNGNATKTQNDIRYIQISLQLGGGTSSIGLTTTVFPRVFSS